MPVCQRQPGFEASFKDVTGNSPDPWQARLLPAGTALAWFYHHVIHGEISR